MSKIKTLAMRMIVITLLTAGCGSGDETAPSNQPTETASDPAAEAGRLTAEALPDLSGETITVYLIGDEGGIHAELTDAFSAGALDFTANLNQNGGIFGADLALKFVTLVGTDEETDEEITEALQTDDLLLALAYSEAEDLLAVRAAVDHIPVIGMGLGQMRGDALEDGYFFRLAPSFEEQFIFLLSYAVSEWEAIRPAGAERPVAGYLTWAGEDSPGGLTDGVRARAAELNLPIAVEAVIRRSPNASATAAILEMEQAGVNLIFTDTYGSGPAVLLNDLHHLGMRGFFTVAGSSWSLEPSLYRYLAEPAYGGGLLAASPQAWWADEGNPAVQQALANAVDNGRPPELLDGGYLLAHGALDLAVTAIRGAVLEEGYEELSPEAVYQALAQMSGYPVLGGLFTAEFVDGSRSLHLLSIRQTGMGPDDLAVLEDYRPMITSGE